jgi:hypothetical protein
VLTPNFASTYRIGRLANDLAFSGLVPSASEDQIRCNAWLGDRLRGQHFGDRVLGPTKILCQCSAA